MALTCVWRRIGVAAAGTIISPLKPDATFNLMKSPGELSRPNRSAKTNDKSQDGIATKGSARATPTINAGRAAVQIAAAPFRRQCPDAHAED